MLWRLRDKYWRLKFRYESWLMLRKVKRIFNNEVIVDNYSPRVLSMANLYSNGTSIPVIAKIFNVTNERVRQCILKFIRTERR